MRNALGAGGVIVGFVGLALIAGGCGGGGGVSAAQSVGYYLSAPPGTIKARVGVTEFRVDAPPSPTTQPFVLSRLVAGGLGETAADDIATLLAKSGRFDVVGRVALMESLQQQGLADAVTAGALVRPARFEGVEYVLTGSLANLSITKKPPTGSTMGKMKSWVQQSTESKQVQVAATCNVGLKLIEPTTGDVVVSNNTQFARTGPAPAFGLDLLQSSASMSESGELPVSAEDREQIVRLALDDAVRKTLPKFDRFLQSRSGLQQGTLAAGATTQPVSPGATTKPAHPTAATPVRPTVSPTPAASPAPTPATVSKTCPSCSAANDPAAKFCRRCGGNL